MDHTELKNLLKDVGVCPLDIKTITPKQSRYSNHANYILSFSKEDFNMKNLHAIKVVNHVIVTWEYHRRSNTGPTQCRRCLRAGHGTRHCNLPARCQYCAENHLSDDCEVFKSAIKAAGGTSTTETRDEDIEGVETANEANNANKKPLKVNFTPKCCNCKGNHLATDKSCTAIAEYQNLQRKLANRNRKQDGRRQLHYDEVSFPQLPHNHQMQRPQVAERRTPQNMSYSQVVNQRPDPVARCGFLSSTQPNSTPITDPNKLFSYAEITALLNDVIQGLRACETKYDQFQVITDLAIKYVYGLSK